LRRFWTRSEPHKLKRPHREFSGEMPRDFNLLATTTRGSEADACVELKYILVELGDEEAVAEETSIKGVITAKTSMNPFEAIRKLREFLREKPWEFRYLIRVIPIERVVRTDLGEIERAAAELAHKIGENESFRVTLEKRFTELHTMDIIRSAAARIDRKVDLENPDKILLVEVVGGFTGLSVIEPQDILNVSKEKPG